MKLKTAIIVLGYGFALIYAAFLAWWILAGGGITPGFAILAALLVASIAVICRKEWGRSFFVSASIIGFVYNITDAFYRQRLDDLTFMLAVVCILAVLFYTRPPVKRRFQLGFDLPEKTVLVIDDDKTFLRMVKKSLQNQGLDVLTAETGEKGFSSAAKYRPDLIILDVILPGMMGKEVCDKLKEDGRTRDIPVMFVTVKGSQEEILAEMEAGGVVHMTKPVDMQDLNAEVKKILGVLS